MKTPLRVLAVEDSDDDAELLRIELRRAGFEVTLERVETAAAFSAALDGQPWDLVLADHSMPTFDAPRALELLKAKQLDLPFILVSGAIRQDLAIALMRAGAHDFVSKDELARLEPVIRRELHQAHNRRARRVAEAERERLIGELEVANRTKDEFLAMLGHELRNPLAPIVTALHLMRLRGDGHPSKEHEIIERQVRHLLRLVDDLLDVAKIAKGKVELKRRVVPLAQVVAQAIEMASPLLEERHHHFRVEVPTRGLEVAGDQERLAQVISNLLTNAARYTPVGGEIQLTAAAEAGQAVLRVKDNGVGIDAAVQPHIFELFVQGVRPIDRSVGGLGLGLTIVRNLVTLHGGTISVHSAGHGLGSEFTLRLPLVAPAGAVVQAPAPAPTPQVAAARNDEGQRVLLVDDNRDALETLADVVRMGGHEVVMANDGAAALLVLEHFTPSVMVLDIGLPEMDGFELARRIRAMPAHRGSMLVALTGYGQDGDRQRCLNAGFDLHMVKPADCARLLGEVRKFVATRSSG